MEAIAAELTKCFLFVFAFALVELFVVFLKGLV